MVVGFHHDVLEFVAQVLFDGRLVVLFHLGVIRQDAHGAKILPAAAFIGSEKFLHRIGSVGAVVQNLCERGMTSTHAGQRIAQYIDLLLDRFLLLTQFLNGGVPVRGLLLQYAQLAGRGFEFMRRGVGVIADLDGRFQQFMFV